MNDIAVQQLVLAKYSGAATEMQAYLTIALQTGAVLVGGIILWRMSARMHKKKMQQRANRTFFETNYSRNWKRR